MTTPNRLKTVLAALTDEWQSTGQISNTTRLPLADTAAALRQLRRDGQCEGVAQGTNGKKWRKA
jgi:hypothetical protein